MVGWYDLPLEVVDKFLSSVADAIVYEFGAQGYSFILDESHPARKVPQPFRDFSNVCRTCRYFHDALTNRIKVNGETCKDALQEIAHKNLMGLFDTAIRIWQYNLHDLSFREERFISVAGRFWLNPRVLRDPSLCNLFRALPYKSVAALIPKLGGWVKENLAHPSSPAGVVQIGLRGSTFSEEVEVKPGPRWVVGERMKIFSIESIVKQSERRPGTLDG